LILLSQEIKKAVGNFFLPTALNIISLVKKPWVDVHPRLLYSLCNMPNQVDSLVAIHHQHDKNVWLFLFIGILKI
jgi:hypothetical protein